MNTFLNRMPWVVTRAMHAVGRHDPWCRGVVGLSCDPLLRPELWR